MAPDFRIDEKYEGRVKQLLEEAKIPYMIPSRESIKSKYLEVPSIGLAVPKERTLFNYNHQDSLNEIHSKGKRIPNMKEFPVILKFAKENDLDFYHEIIQVRSPWRAEWIDAKFENKGEDLFVTYHIFDDKGNIQENIEELDKDTLMNDKVPGISIDSWLEDSTPQGLPKNSNLGGNLFYLHPRNNHVARFYADESRAYLDAYRDPSSWNPVLGVRAAEWLK